MEVAEIDWQKQIELKFFVDLSFRGVPCFAPPMTLRRSVRGKRRKLNSGFTMFKERRLALMMPLAFLLIHSFGVNAHSQGVEKDFVSILDFGAVPNDPTQPCDEALKKARNASSIVRFPNIDRNSSTRYFLAKNYELKPGEIWEGDGKLYAAAGSSLIRLSDEVDQPFIKTFRSTIRDICIVGDKDNRAGVGIELAAASTLTNVGVRYFEHGLATSDNWQSVVDRCTFVENVKSGLFLARNKRNNIVTIRDCDFARNDYGVMMEGSSRSVHLVGCTIQGNRKGGFLQFGNPAAVGCSIQDCWFELNPTHVHLEGRSIGFRLTGNFFVTNGQSSGNKAIVLDAKTATGGKPWITRPEIRSNFFYNDESALADIFIDGSRVRSPIMPDRGGSGIDKFGIGKEVVVQPNFRPQKE